MRITKEISLLHLCGLMLLVFKGEEFNLWNWSLFYEGGFVKGEKEIDCSCSWELLLRTPFMKF